MSTSTWEGPQFYVDEVYPPALLKYLLQQMMTQFTAQGACIALYDEQMHQMRIRLHVRLHSAADGVQVGFDEARSQRVTASVDSDISSASSSPRTGPLSPLLGRLSPIRQHSPSVSHPLPPLSPPEELYEVPRQQCELFAVGASFLPDVDLIGWAWAKNETFMIRHDEYLNRYYHGGPLPFRVDVTPTSYFVIPIQESTLVDDMRDRPRRAETLGVIVLYQTISGIATPFHSRQREEALHQAERIALYLQNDKLQRAQRRTSEYLRRIQAISTVFPTSVKLSELVETVHSFVSQIVNISSMLFTLYDRDTNKIYDIFAMCNSTRVEYLTEKPNITYPEERPVWWRVTQVEKRRLLFSPTEDQEKADIYAELLEGLWGDQHNAGSFLLLPLRMFNRVIGSLCLTSMRPNAYHTEEIQVLETMAQIVTVSIENAKLYERDRTLLHEAAQRESLLAGLNSALQAVSSNLNVTELLSSMVNSVADLLKVEVCVFFQPLPEKEELVARALHTPFNTNPYDDGSGIPAMHPSEKDLMHVELVEQIHLPFKGSILEQLVVEPFFYLDKPGIEELAQQSSEGGKIFLSETGMQQLLMVPMTYQNDLVGVLAVSTPHKARSFRPREIATLMAACAQTIGAIRNAQLFTDREEAYAELQRLDKLKDEFLVTASHELRTPLSAISGYATLLKRQNTRIEPQQILRYATKIAGSAQQLNDIITNMTEASKIGTVDKKLDLQIGPVMVKAAADMAVTMLSINIEQHISLTVKQGLCVTGDPLRVRQVMTNLLDNAAKYSSPESLIQLTAAATTYGQLESIMPPDLFGQEDNNLPVVLVRVIDQGEGITPEDQKKIFEKFYRAPRSLTTPVRGSGLGLYICRRYIEAMNGTLWLERSTPHEGSVFSFYLPQTESVGEPDESQFTIE